MAAPFTCFGCSRPIDPDTTGLVAFSATQPAATLHAVCRQSRGARTPIERLRHGPIGILADILSSPNGRPWSDSLPESVRELCKELFRVEVANAAEGKS